MQTHVFSGLSTHLYTISSLPCLGFLLVLACSCAFHHLLPLIASPSSMAHHLRPLQRATTSPPSALLPLTALIPSTS